MNKASWAEAQAKQGSNKWKKRTNRQKLLQKAHQKSLWQLNYLTKEILKLKIDKVWSISLMNLRDRRNTLTIRFPGQFMINCQVRDITATKVIRKGWGHSVPIIRCRRKERRKGQDPKVRRDLGLQMKIIRFIRLLIWYRLLITTTPQWESHCFTLDLVLELISKTKGTTQTSTCKRWVNINSNVANPLANKIFLKDFILIKFQNTDLLTLADHRWTRQFCCRSFSNAKTINKSKLEASTLHKCKLTKKLICSGLTWVRFTESQRNLALPRRRDLSCSR